MNNNNQEDNSLSILLNSGNAPQTNDLSNNNISTNSNLINNTNTNVYNPLSKVDTDNYYDDNLAQKTFSIVIGEDLIGFDTAYQSAILESGEENLKDYGVFSKRHHAWEDQGFWEATDTVLSATAAAATTATIGMAAAGFWNPVGWAGAIGSGTVALGARALRKGLGLVTDIDRAANKIQVAAKQAESTLKGINNVDILDNIAGSTDINSISGSLKQLLGDNYGMYITKQDAETLSIVLKNETNPTAIKNVLENHITRKFDETTYRDKQTVADEALRIRAEVATESGIPIMLKSVEKNSGIYDVEKQLRFENYKVDKATTKTANDVKALKMAHQDLKSLSTSGDALKYSTKDINDFAYFKAGAEVFKRTEDIQLSKVGKLVKNATSPEEIVSLLKDYSLFETPSLTKLANEYSGVGDAFKFNTQKQFDDFKTGFSNSIKNIKKERNLTIRNDIKNVADKISKNRSGRHYKETHAISKRQLLTAKVVKTTSKQKEILVKMSNDIKSNKKKLSVENTRDLIKNAREEFTKVLDKLPNSFRLRTNLNKAKSIDALLKVIADIEKAVDLKVINKHKSQVAVVKQSKKKVLRQLTSKTGKMGELVKWMEDELFQIGVQTKEADNLIKSFTSKIDEIKAIDIKDLSVEKLDKYNVDLLKLMDRYSKTILEYKAPIEAMKKFQKMQIKYAQDVIKADGMVGAKEYTSGDGWFNAVKRGFIDQMFNGDGLTIMDATNFLNNLIHIPQYKALGQVQIKSTKSRMELAKIAKENGLDNRHDIGLISDIAHLSRDDKGIHKWYIEKDELFNDVVLKNLKDNFNVKLDTTSLTKQADDFVDELNAGLKDNKKMSIEEFAVKKTYEYRRLVVEIYSSELNKLINGKTVKGIGMKKWITTAAKTTKKYHKAAKKVHRVFDSKVKLPKEMDNYTMKGVTMKMDGSPSRNGFDAIDKDKPGDGIFGWFSNTDSPVLPQTVKNKNIFSLQKHTNSEYTLTRNAPYDMDKGLNDILMYSEMRPVQDTIFKTLNGSVDTLGTDFVKMFKDEVATNTTFAQIKGKSEAAQIVDKITRNATFGVLGAKISPIVAQITAIPEWLGTFRSPLEGTRAWFDGSNTIKKYSDDVDLFLEAQSPEYLSRAHKEYSKGKASARFSGSSEAYDSASTKYAEGTGRAWETAQEWSMLGIQKVDAAIYKRALVGTYITVLKKKGLSVDPNIMLHPDLENISKAHSMALLEAEMQTSRGMGSVNIANKSMFNKIGRQGRIGAQGEYQTPVRAFTFAQSFVYNSFSRMVIEGAVKPTRLWKAGKKMEAVQELTTEITMEMIGKMMYLNNAEKIRRLTDLYLGGDGEETDYDASPMQNRLVGEMIAHTPILGSLYGTTEFSDVKGIPSHIAGVHWAGTMVFDLLTGEKEFGEISEWDQVKLGRTMGVMVGLPGSTEFSMDYYKYQKNNKPEHELARTKYEFSRKEVAKQNDDLVEWYIDEEIIEGRNIEDIYEDIKKNEPARYKKLMVNVSLEVKYEDDADEIRKIMKYTNNNKAKWFVSLSEEEQLKWKPIITDLGLYTKDLRKKINLEKAK